MALCPLHADEKTKSFHILPGDERWHCFAGCGGGDIFEFVQKKHNIQIMEAVRMVAKEVNVQVSPEEEGRIRAFKELQDRNSTMLTKAAQELHEDLNADLYLSSRKLTPDAVKHFGLGYRPDANAISIPIHDRFNRLVGYSLRMISPGPHEPKYKNSKADELGLFKKKELLYNLGAVRADIKKKIFLVEGYFDCIALHMAGFKNTVAICQAILTKEQLAVLHEAILPDTEVVFVPDCDAPGLEALQKNIYMLRAYSKERSIRVALVESVLGAKDAGEAFVKDQAGLKTAIEGADQAELVMLKKVIETETDRTKQYQMAKPIVSSVSALLRDDLMTYLAEAWDKDKKLLSSYFGADVKDADPSAFNGPLDMPDQYLAYVKNVHAHGVSFKIPSLDRLIRRIAPGEVCYLQARTSVGKTAAALNFMGQFSKQKLPVLFFSLEQQKEQIFERMMQISNHVTGIEIERLTHNMDQRLLDMHNNFYEMFKNVWVVDKPSMTLSSIKEHILQFAAINTFPQVIVIDYFGYIKGEGRDRDVYEESSRKAKDIKSLAKELNNAWVVLHQLSRAGGSGGEPVTLDMGRDSGVIEESADQLMGFWRPELEKDISPEERLKREQESKLVGAVLKNRSGPTGQVHFRFDRRTLIVKEWDPTYHAAVSDQEKAAEEAQGELIPS
jgi:hypothetical protein